MTPAEQCSDLDRETARIRALGRVPLPLFPGTRPEQTARSAASREVDLDRESIWISYRPLSLEPRGPSNLSQFSRHRLATSVSPWERLKIGCGTPAVLRRGTVG